MESLAVHQRSASEASFGRCVRYHCRRTAAKLVNALCPTEPTPLLSRSFYYRGRIRTIALEPAWIHLTRPLSVPWLLAILVVAYIIGFAFFSRAQSFLVPADSFIGCTSTYWLANDGCGLDGQNCGPFDNSTFDFRCPAQCNSVILQNPRTVGDEQIAFVPLIVGGGDTNVTYRGDSFICSAATQA